MGEGVSGSWSFSPASYILILGFWGLVSIAGVGSNVSASCFLLIIKLYSAGCFEY